MQPVVVALSKTASAKAGAHLDPIIVKPVTPPSVNGA